MLYIIDVTDKKNGFQNPIRRLKIWPTRWRLQVGENVPRKIQPDVDCQLRSGARAHRNWFKTFFAFKTSSYLQLHTCFFCSARWIRM